MQFDLLSIFPDFFRSPLESSLLAKATSAGLVSVNIYDLRKFATGKHRQVDDTPYGGGSGMVMKPEPLVVGLEAVTRKTGKVTRIFLSPQGRPLDQKKVQDLAGFDQIVLLCGRYEGVDERVIQGWIDEEVSIGDYIIMGGELAALVLVEAVSRLIPGVVGDEDSVSHDTFSHGILKYPQYTRPQEFRGLKFPDVLVSGDHRAIDLWRLEEAKRRTASRRPDLIKKSH